jgi:hypothetical protein
LGKVIEEWRDITAAANEKDVSAWPIDLVNRISEKLIICKKKNG